MLSRLSVVRRLPRTFAVRYYTDGRSAGSVAQSKDFGKIEKANEDWYIRAREKLKLEMLKAEIEAKQAELESLEKKHSEPEKKE